MEQKFPIRNPWRLVDYASNRGERSVNDCREAPTNLLLIDCGLGDSPFGPPKELIRILESSIKDNVLTETIWKYPADRFCEQPTGLIRKRFGLSENPIIVFHGEGSYGLLAKIILELPDLTSIVIRGLAKIIGAAGLRVGYGIFSKEIGEIFQSLQLVFGVSGPQQLIINELLKPEILEPHITGVRDQIRLLKGELTGGLQNLGIKIFPSHPNVPIFLAQGPKGFFQLLKKYQIVTERGLDFRATYPLDDSFVRMRIPATFEEVQEILKRVERILT